MSIFYPHKSAARYGALIEIGSGSVTVSILESIVSKPHPTIIWTAREFSPLKKAIAVENQAIKNLMGSLMNVTLLIDSVGRNALKAYNPSAHISHVQISITAPWSYTVSKIINYHKDSDFVITPELIQNLITTAEKKGGVEQVEKAVTNDRGLTVITRATTDIKVNGYESKTPLNQLARELTLNQISSVAQSIIVDMSIDLQRKVLPHVTTTSISYMLMFHGVVADLYQNIKDYCLVDVTYEATELGIVRNGALQYCTNTAIGLNTLVRGLAKKLDIPHEEAHSFLREPYYSTGRAALSETKLEAMDSLLAEYLVALTSLFNETADTLSIPRVVFLHGNTFANAIVRPQVTTAAKMSAGSSPTVYDISDAILTTLYDTADRKALELVTSQPSMLLAAQFFHKPQPWHSIVED